MRNKSVEIVSAIMAIGVVLSAVSGYGLHRRMRKSCGCKMASAECYDAFESGGLLDAVEAQSAKNDETFKSSLFSNAKAAYVMENTSETAVFEKEALKRLPIASMCKIMTLILAFDAIDQGIMTMDEEITVSENAAAMGGSQVFLEANAKYPVRELIKSIVVCSANDSCVAIAEKVSGSDQLFVEKMNEKARELGCENTLFANCTGLPKEPQYSCAKDVAIMLKELLTYGEYYQFGKIWTDTFHHPEGRTTEISNTNRLVRFYEGCDGGKTGFTNEAGFCLAATAKRGNLRVISVAIGETDSKTRFKEISESFDYTFANYQMTTVVDSQKQIDGEISVSGGKEKSVSVKPVRDGYLFLKRGEKSDHRVEISVCDRLKAPVKAGESVGYATIFKDGIEYDKIPLIATADITKAGYLDALREIANSWNFSAKR